jgi:hypothetical protein
MTYEQEQELALAKKWLSRRPWIGSMASSAEFYRWVSAAIRRVADRKDSESDARVVIGEIVCELSLIFRERNTEFDPDRFLKDCGL